MSSGSDIDFNKSPLGSDVDERGKLFCWLIPQQSRSQEKVIFWCQGKSKIPDTNKLLDNRDHSRSPRVPRWDSAPHKLRGASSKLYSEATKTGSPLTAKVAMSWEQHVVHSKSAMQFLRMVGRVQHQLPAGDQTQGINPHSQDEGQGRISSWILVQKACWVITLWGWIAQCYR